LTSSSCTGPAFPFTCSPSEAVLNKVQTHLPPPPTAVNGPVIRGGGLSAVMAGYESNTAEDLAVIGVVHTLRT